MTSFWMIDNDTITNTITSNMYDFLAQITNIGIKCYPASASDKYLNNGLLDNSTLNRISAKSQISCSFHKSHDGKEFIYYN